MDNTQYIKDLADAEKRNKQTLLDQQRAESLKAVEQEQAKVMPTFEKNRQATNVNSQIGAKNLAEFWANRSQTNAGINAQVEMSRVNTLGNNINAIDTQEQDAVTDFSNKKLGVNTTYQNNLTNANNEIDTTLNTNLYNEKLRQDDARVAAAKEASDNAYRWASLNKTKEVDNTGKVNSYKGLTIPYQAGVQGVPNGNKVIYSLPQADGSISQLELDRGVNPFTGTANKDVKTKDPISKKETWSVFGNGYQPDNISGNKLAKSGVKTTVNGQDQNVWKVSTGATGGFLGIGQTAASSKYYVWDGANNKYWELSSAEKKALGLK